MNKKEALPVQAQPPIDQSVQLESPLSVQVQGEEPSTEARSHIDQCLPEVESVPETKTPEVKEFKAFSDGKSKRMTEYKGKVADVPAETPVCTAKASARPLAKSIHSSQFSVLAYESFARLAGFFSSQA